MDCQTALQLIEMLPEGAAGWRSAEGETVRSHLSECPLCQSVATDIGEWDHRLHAVMVTVPVPDGLRERLLAQLSDSASPSLAQAPAIASPPKSLRRILAGLSLSLALVAGMAFWISQPPQLQMASIQESAVRMLENRPPAGLSAFDGSFAAEILDAKWSKVCASPPVGLNLDGRAGHDVAAFRVNIPSLRFRGWLVLVPISRVADLPTNSIPTMSSYARTASWNDGKYVFVCLSEQGSLQSLVDQFQGGAA